VPTDERVRSSGGPYRSEGEASRLLQEFETQHDLLRYTLDGFSVWPTLRFEVSRRLQNIPFAAGSSPPVARGPIYRRVATDLARAAALPRARHVAFTFTGARRIPQNGRSKDIFFDDLLERLGDGIKIEQQVGQGIDGLPPLVPCRLTRTGLDVIGRRMARHLPAPTRTRNLAKTFSELLASELDVRDFTPDMVSQRFHQFSWLRRTWQLALRRMGARVVFVADAEHPIIAAARELGVHVLELQHGMLTRDFPGNSWTRYALPYKTQMPIPTKLLLFGEYWKEELATNGFWDTELTVVGSTYLDEFRRQARANDDGRKRIVVSTQGVDTEKVAGFLEQLLRVAERRLPIEVIVKLHPIYDTDPGPYVKAFHGKDNAKVLSASEKPSTLELIRGASLHLSIYSNCHFDAIGLGTPTAILPFTGVENVLPLAKKGHATVVNTPGELLALLETPQTAKAAAAASDWYYRPGALNNITEVLERLG
jgi:hypothetical protein